MKMLRRDLLLATMTAVALAAGAADTVAPADELARGKVAVGIPDAPEGYRRPKGWKPVAYPKTLAEIARDHSQDTMKRAREQLFKVRQTNALGKYQPFGKSIDRHACPEWFVDAKLGVFIDWGPGTLPCCREGAKTIVRIPNDLAAGDVAFALECE